MDSPRIASERFEDAETVEAVCRLIETEGFNKSIPRLFDKIAAIAVKAAGLDDRKVAVYINRGRDNCCDARPEGVRITVKLI